jgi:hypothetical protein
MRTLGNKKPGEDIMSWLKSKPATEVATLQEGRKIFLDKHPELVAIFNPRVYKNVDRFGDYKLPAITYGSTLLAGKSDPKLLNSTSFLKQLLTGSLWAKYGAPRFFVTEEIFRAAMMTDPPEKIDWKTLNLPFETAVFVFPRNLLHLPNGEGPCHFAIYSRIKPALYTVDLGGLYHRIQYNDHTFTISTFSQVHYYEYLTNYTQPYFVGMDIPNLCDSESSDADFLVLNQDEAQTNFLISKIIFNLLMIMNHRPQMVEMGERVKVHKKKHNSEIWTPNIIGKKYYVKGRVQNQTESFRRMHWRRGHWRKQPYGEYIVMEQPNGNKSHEFIMFRDIWIEPCLVAAEK